jgi:hypothetical protein
LFLNDISQGIFISLYISNPPRYIGKWKKYQKFIWGISQLEK